MYKKKMVKTYAEALKGCVPDTYKAQEIADKGDASLQSAEDVEKTHDKADIQSEASDSGVSLIYPHWRTGFAYTDFGQTNRSKEDKPITPIRRSPSKSAKSVRTSTSASQDTQDLAITGAAFCDQSSEIISKPGKVKSKTSNLLHESTFAKKTGNEPPRKVSHLQSFPRINRNQSSDDDCSTSPRKKMKTTEDSMIHISSDPGCSSEKMHYCRHDAATGIKRKGKDENMWTSGNNNWKEIKYYNNDPNLPIFSESNMGVKTLKAVTYLCNDNLQERRVACAVPTDISDNVSFIVSLKYIDHWKNILSDNMGAWTQNGTMKKIVQWVNGYPKYSKEVSYSTDLFVYRYTYINTSSPDLHRIVIRVENPRDCSVRDKVYVQYYFDEKPHPIQVKQRANKTHDSSSYSLTLEVMDMSKNESVPFIRDILAAPELIVFLTTDIQLEEVEKFCTNSANFGILGVDSTFNIGNFYVTLTTYKHLLLEHKTKGYEPVMIGPTIIHQTRVFDSYYILPSFMIKHKPSLSDVLCYATDGDVNLSNAFKICMPYAHHLQCDRHMKDSISRKLSSHNIGLGHKTVSLPLFVRQFKKIVDRQQEETKLAIIGRGEFRLKKEYSHLAVDENKYYTLSAEEKAMVYRKCLLADLKVRALEKIEGNDREGNSWDTDRSPLSVNRDQSHIINIMSPILQEMFKKDQSSK
ncbi:uncharacterized protein [Ptychodera flava]|uniref:uncharacterized protein n=1 Tax=Ptychodera flava TaxID=63121 RepID=UPI00396A6606